MKTVKRECYRTYSCLLQQNQKKLYIKLQKSRRLRKSEKKHLNYLSLME